MNQQNKKQLLVQLAALENNISRLYGNAYAQALGLDEVRKAIKDEDDNFSWEDHPAAKKKLEKIIANLNKATSRLISSQAEGAGKRAVKQSWDEIEKVSKGSVEQEDIDEIRGKAEAVHRGRAASSAEKRGLDISKRVWNYNESTKKEMEVIIQNGIKEGKSAEQIQAMVKGYLNDPNALFRRVRNKKTGRLELSEAAKDYHPGTGVYRSAYKNAMRLARTEVNMAYREAEWLTYQDNPLIVSYEIRLSNNHTTLNSQGVPVALFDICDKLAGVYPKSFRWTGWHPQCRCAMIPVPLTPEQYREYRKAKESGRLAEWTRDMGKVGLPECYKNWVIENADRVEYAMASGKMPYFIRDNMDATNVILHPETMAQKAKRRHEERTEAEVADIKARWAEHQRIQAEIKAIMASNTKPYYEGRFADEIDACTSVKDLVDVLVANKVVTSAKFGTMRLEDAKVVSKALAEVQRRFTLRPIEIRFGGTSRASWSMRANGGHVEINAGLWKGAGVEDRIKRMFYDSVQNYRNRQEKSKAALESNRDLYIKMLDDAKKTGNKASEKYYKSALKKCEKEIKRIETILNSGVSRFTQQLSRETFLRDTLVHELGHVLHDQILGGINGVAFRRARYDVADAHKMNDEFMKLYAKYKDGDRFMTEYGMTKWTEMVAESTVLYMYRPDKLSSDVRDWFERVEKMAHGGKLPKDVSISYDEAYKLWSNGSYLHDKLMKEAERRHAARTKGDIDDIMARWAEHEKMIEEARHNAIVEYAEQKYIRNMSSVVKQYMDDGEKSLFDSRLSSIDGVDDKIAFIRGKRNEIKGIISDVWDAVVSSKSFLNATDVADYKAKAAVSIRSKDVKIMKDLKSEIEGLPKEIASWDGVVENPIDKVKSCGLDYTREAVRVIGDVDSKLKSMSLDDMLSTLKTYETTSKPIYKEEFERRRKYTEVSIKIRDLKPAIDDITDAAYKSSFDSFKNLALDVLNAEKGRDVTSLESLIMKGNEFKGAVERYEDLKKYVTKSAKFGKAMDEARDSIGVGDIPKAISMLDRAQKEKDILESSKAYHAAKRAAEKAAKAAGKNVSPTTEPTVAKIDENAYVPKTLDELRAEMGSALPATLAVIDKVMAKYERSSKYGADAKKHKDEIEETMRELFEKHDYGMNMRSDILELVMGSWFKNTFETGSSGGYSGSSKTSGKIETGHGRLQFTHEMFMNGRSLDDQLARGDYEKYGNLLDHDIERSLNGFNSASNYGEVEVRFKKTKVIATWTAGDSLARTYMPSLTTDPKACSYDNIRGSMLPVKGTQTDNMNMFRNNNIRSYLELQYHGKLTIDCVDSVAFRTDINRSRQDKKTADLCVAHGIKVYHLVNGKMQVYGDPATLAKIWKEKVDRRHADRLDKLHKSGKTLEDAIREAIDARTKMHMDARKEAIGAKGEVELMKCKDLDDGGYTNAIKEGDYMKARGYLKSMREEHLKLKAREDAIIDLIPDVAALHKDFTIGELEAAHRAIKKKFEYIEKKYPGNLKKQSEQLTFEIGYIETPANQKFATWYVARDAYKAKLAEVMKTIKIDEVKQGLADLKGFKSRLKAVKDAIGEAEVMIAAGDYDGASAKIAEANTIRMAHDAKNWAKAKPGEAVQRLFESEAFSKARKDAALWEKDERDPQKAFNRIDSIMSKYAEDLWSKLTDEEKHVAWLYTSGSRYINEPFFTTYSGVKRSMHDGSIRNGVKDINTLTSIIEKSMPIENDMWVQHAEDMSAFSSRFGVSVMDLMNPSKVIGKEGVNEPFMSTSCAKNSFFTKKDLRDLPIVMSIYLPKGTKGIYCEPFAFYGDGRTYSEDTSLRYGVDGLKWDGKSRQKSGIAAGDQVEFLLQRGAKLRITDVKCADGRYYVECELVEQMARPKFSSR